MFSLRPLCDIDNVPVRGNIHKRDLRREADKFQIGAFLNELQEGGGKRSKTY